MRYWIKINGVSEGPLTEQEIFRKYGGSLTRDTPCSEVGTNTWITIGYYFPEWENPGSIFFNSPQQQKPPSRYPKLVFYRTIFRILALFGIVYGVFKILMVLFGFNVTESLETTIMDLVETFFEVIINLAVAEVITILFDIEQNTRKPAATQVATPQRPPSPPTDFA